jgi:DNA-binding MarR family transcriptional regulator
VSDAWTPLTVASELLELMPVFGRMMFSQVQMEDSEERTTMMQVRALFFMIDDRLSVSDLAKKRRVSMQSASTLVQGLVERGWVTRVPDPNDRRRSVLQVTPEGHERAQWAREYMARGLAAFLEGLTPDELAAASVFLPALTRLIHEHLAAGDDSRTPASGPPG